MSFCSLMRRLRASRSPSMNCWGVPRTCSHGSTPPMTSRVELLVPSATSTPRRTRLRKLAASWRRLTHSREGFRQFCAARGFLLSCWRSCPGWRIDTRGGPDPGRAARTSSRVTIRLRSNFLPSARQRGCPGTRRFATRNRANAGSTGDIEAIPFRLRRAGVAAADRVGRGLPRGGAESAGQFHVRSAQLRCCRPWGATIRKVPLRYSTTGLWRWTNSDGLWKRRNFFDARSTSVAPGRRKRQFLRCSSTTMPRRCISWVVSTKRPTIPNGHTPRDCKPAIRR